jgi:hypothetical protein
MVILLAYLLRNLSLTGPGKVSLFRTGQRKITLLFTLFTFCPPGPPLRA